MRCRAGTTAAGHATRTILEAVRGTGCTRSRKFSRRGGSDAAADPTKKHAAGAGGDIRRIDKKKKIKEEKEEDTTTKRRLPLKEYVSVRMGGGGEVTDLPL